MKKILMTLTLLAAAALLSACASKPDMTTATNSPEPTASEPTFPDMLPTATGILPQVQDGMNEMLDGLTGQPTDMPTASPESTGVTSMDTARRVVEQIEDELERLSEVEDAEVVIAGSKAAVGVEFDDQYRTGLDERMRKIIKERIDSVIGGINTVAITADEGVRDAIESLGERLDTMGDMAALQSDLDAIIKKINGMNA